MDAIRDGSRPQPGRRPTPNRSVEVVMRMNRDFQNVHPQRFHGQPDHRRISRRSRGQLCSAATRADAQDGQEIPGKEEKAMKEIVERGADLMQNLNALSTQIGAIVDSLQRGQGTLGKLLTDQTTYNRLNDTSRARRSDHCIIQQGQGTIGKLVSSDALYTKLTPATGRLDNVLAAVEEQKGRSASSSTTRASMRAPSSF